MLPRFVAVPVSTRAPRNVSAANATTAQRWVLRRGYSQLKTQDLKHRCSKKGKEKLERGI